MSTYRPEVLTNPNYEASEPIDEDCRLGRLFVVPSLRQPELPCCTDHVASEDEGVEE
jgi:hypothetical protein